MSRRALYAMGVSTALGIVAASTTLAVAQNTGQFLRSMTDDWGQPNPLGALASNEGIYVNAKDFTVAKGAAKGDPSAQIAKSGAREVTDGAIIFRSGNKLYIVDGTPPAQ
jgi:hypothetical protein